MWTCLWPQDCPQAVHIQLHEFTGAEQVLGLAGRCKQLTVLSPQLWLIRLRAFEWYAPCSHFSR